MESLITPALQARLETLRDTETDDLQRLDPPFHEHG